MSNLNPFDVLVEEMMKELDQLILAHIAIQSGFHAGNNTIGDVDKAGDNIKTLIRTTLTHTAHAVREATVRECLEVVDDHCTWYNTNNQIPDTELEKGTEHWEMIRKAVKDSLIEVNARILATLSTKEHEQT